MRWLRSNSSGRSEPGAVPPMYTMLRSLLFGVARLILRPS